MSRFDTTSPEFQSLLLAACSEDATPAQLAQLEELVDAESAMQLLIDYLQLDGELHRIICQQSSEDKCLERFEARIPCDRPATERFKSVPPIFPLPSNTIHGTVGYFSSGWPVAYLVASVILGLGLLVGAYVHVSTPVQVVQRSVPSPSTLAPSPSSRMPFVGRITGMVDCEWADPDTEAFNGANVPLGRKYALASGLMEITYETGAKVILQGPVTYEVESAAGGFLSVGKLTARMETKEERRTKNEEPSGSRSSFLIPHSYFSVRTPTATVTDLGTEFGVEVSEEGCTTSRVYRGSVKLEVISSDGKVEGEAKVLHENESARVENRGGDRVGGNRVTVLGPSSKPVEFVRKIRRKTVRTLDLVDMVAGGNGFGKARDCGIDPTTGKTSTKQPDNSNLWGDGHYHKVPERPLIDGVFIPCPAKGPVQLDSVGHAFAGFPTTVGSTWGYIWAGGPLANVLDGNLPTALMRGLDYSAPWHSLLGMHANKGITFDLAAIRRENPRGKLIRFSAVAGKCVREHPGKSDVWVFVDGRLRFQREQITAEDGELKIAVALDDESRFLTLAATDGGDGPYEDVVIFGDPKLVLAEYSE